MRIKVLSLTQPWATLVAIGAKRIETRSWPTSYRGPLGIHAAMGFPGDCKALCGEPPFAGALVGQGVLPRGVILCVTSLIGCRRTEDLRANISANELAFGDYSDKRYGFGLGPIVPLLAPIRARGMLGLWNFEISEVAPTAFQPLGQMELL